jgi:uncharacterized phage-associated protein
MSVNAIAVANYFVDLAKKNNVVIRQFGLMKRVYLTHGFSLAFYDMSALDEQFDIVEAWRNGPVIPSVYYSFKHNGANPITDKSIITDFQDGNTVITTPELQDEKIKLVADFVWDRYKEMTDFQLVELTHKAGTPWALCYREGMNNPIPDIYTKTFYKKLLVWP